MTPTPEPEGASKQQALLDALLKLAREVESIRDFVEPFLEDQSEDISLAQTESVATPRSFALTRILKTPATINNGGIYRYQQPTIKGRIMAALRDAKEAGR